MTKFVVETRPREDGQWESVVSMSHVNLGTMGGQFHGSAPAKTEEEALALAVPLVFRMLEDVTS